MKVKLPDASAVTVPVAAPLSVTVVPAPLAAGLIVPEMLHVGTGDTVKLTPVTFAPLTVTDWLAGLNVKPVFDGVTVYVPLASPVNVKLPDASAVTVPVAAPLSVTAVPAPFAAGLTVPEMFHVGTGDTVKLTPVTFAPLTVTDWLAGLNVKPVFDGVTVYVPLANPVNVKLPDASAVTVPVAAPLSVTVVPAPFAAGVTAPETLHVGVPGGRISQIVRL